MRRCARRVFSCIERAVTAMLYPWCRRRQRPRPRIPILMYHQIGIPSPGAPPCRDCVSPGRFETQIRAILDAGYRIIPLSALIGALQEDTAPVAEPSVVLTFDDGYRGQYLHAYPVLRRDRLPATFFVIAGAVGQRSLFRHLSGPDAGACEPPPDWLPLSWDEVEEMTRHGIAVGSHSLSHRSLGALARDDAANELRASKAILEERLSAPVDLFAYPFGSRAYGDFDRGLGVLLRREGYRAAVTTVVGSSHSGADLYALPRIPMEEGDGPFRVRCKLAGAYDWVGGMKTLWQSLLAREERVA